MKPLPDAWLSRQRLNAAFTMLDRCQVLAHSPNGRDAHNQPQYSYTAGEETPCGVKTAVNRQVEEAGKVVLVDYVIRLPHGTAVGSLDRIRLTKLFGAPDFAQVDCEIVGQVQYGATAVVANLKTIVDGS
jgi:hypothetical protein